MWWSPDDADLAGWLAMTRAKIVLGSGVLGCSLVATATVGYLALGRARCLTWGASHDEVVSELPGDELLLPPCFVATRAVTIKANPSDIWPWLMQMGSGKGGVYTYDWIENLFGLHMHSVNVILPQFQDRKVGDVEQLGQNGPRLRVEELQAERAMVLRAEDGNWIWSFVLSPTGDGETRLISRNRIVTPGANVFQRVFQTLVMEPGSLVMERKMLIGIKERAEKLAVNRACEGFTSSAHP